MAIARGRRATMTNFQSNNRHGKMAREMIRALAPNACIAISGPDVRWRGNEAGRTRQSEWSSVAVPKSYPDWKWDGTTLSDLGSRSKLEKAQFVKWWPSEVNTSIRHGWFWRNEKQHVKSAESIYDIYERLMLLNPPPSSNH